MKIDIRLKWISKLLTTTSISWSVLNSVSWKLLSINKRTIFTVSRNRIHRPKATAANQSNFLKLGILLIALLQFLWAFFVHVIFISTKFQIYFYQLDLIGGIIKLLQVSHFFCCKYIESPVTSVIEPDSRRWTGNDPRLPPEAMPDDRWWSLFTLDVAVTEAVFSTSDAPM